MPKEPTRLEFPSAAPSPVPAKTMAEGAPSAIVFPTTPKPTQNAQKTSAAPDALHAPDCRPAPQALNFPVAAPKTAPKGVAPAFQVHKHPLQNSVLKAATAFAPDTVKGQEPRLERIIGELLPLKIDTIENFGSHMLEQCRQHAERTSKAIHTLSQLRVAETLNAIVAALNPPTSVVQKLKQKLTGASLTEHRDKLQVVRPLLAESLKELRAVLPEAKEDALRLTLHLLALRSTLHVVGAPTDTSLARACELRLDTLRVAVTQAAMVPQKMKSHEDTASLQMAEIDRLLAVTLSATAIAQAAR